jgi:hypothetical protein
MGLVYFVVKRRLLLTDLPATTAPGPDLQSIIHAEFAVLVPGLRSELLVFAETRLQQLAKERDEASAFISNRRNIESWIVSTGKWLWRNKVKGGAIIMALLTSGAAGAGVFSTIAQLVTKVLQP